MELGLFDQVADALRASVPAEFGDLRTAPRRWGIKAWFEVEDCPKEHYEAQVVPAKYVDGAEHLAIEVGFHTEHPQADDNGAVMAPIVAAESSWRAELGPEATAGAFLGRKGWQRLSETWADPDLGDPELCFELAECLATYITTIEPLRHR